MFVDRDDLIEICKNIHTMHSLQSPFICKAHGGCILNENQIWIILEYSGSGDLHHYLSSSSSLLSSTLQLSFSRCVAQTFKFLHSKSIYKNFQSHHFLLSNNNTEVILCLGILTRGDEREQENTEDSEKRNKQISIISLGILMYEIVTTKVVFNDLSHQETIEWLQDKCPVFIISFIILKHINFNTHFIIQKIVEAIKNCWKKPEGVNACGKILGILFFIFLYLLSLTFNCSLSR